MKDWSRVMSWIPERGGVYSVWVGDRIIYIGYSRRNMRLRLLSHNKRKQFIEMGVTGFKWLTKNHGIFNEWAESALIYKHRPALCRQGRFGIRQKPTSKERWAEEESFQWIGITIRYEHSPQPEGVDRG